MKLPPYLHVNWDIKPTEFDKIGCDGMYIKSIKCDWWYYPILIFKRITGCFSLFLLSEIFTPDINDQFRSILRDIVDSDECSYDHHGYCQTHGWTSIDPPCPHKRAKDLLRKTDKNKGETE